MSPGDNQFKKGTLEGSRQEFCCKRTEEDHTKVVQSTHGVRGEAWGGRHRGTGGRRVCDIQLPSSPAMGPVAMGMEKEEQSLGEHGE